MSTKFSYLSSILMIAFIFFTLNLYSQKNFQEGYIVTLEKDTVHGMINYRAWAKNPQQIEFRKSSEGKPVSYLPLEIEAFNVGDEFFKSGIVTKENSPFTLQEMTIDKEPSFEKDTVFLRSLIEGEKSLFVLKESFRKTQFYIGRRDSFELLVHKRYLKMKDTYNLSKKEVIKEYKGYVAQLSNYLTDCKTFHTQLPSIEYDENNLLELFQFYYECVNQKIDFEINDEKTTLNFGVLGGVSITSLDFTKDEDVLTSGSFDYLVVPDYPGFTFFSGGVYLDVIFKRKLKRFSFYNELLYTRYQSEINFESSSILNKVDLSFSQIKMMNMARFNLPIKNNVLYLNGGITLGYLIGLKNERVKEYLLTTTPKIENLEALERPLKLERGLVVGIGARINRFSGEIQYERGGGLSSYSLIISPTQRLYFLVGYQLGSR